MINLVSSDDIKSMFNIGDIKYHCLFVNYVSATTFGEERVHEQAQEEKIVFQLPLETFEREVSKLDIIIAYGTRLIILIII